MHTHKVFRQGLFEGQVLLVTGGGTGIGYEIVKQASLLGAKGVAICGGWNCFLRLTAKGRREEPLKQAKDEIERLTKTKIFSSTCES